MQKSNSHKKVHKIVLTLLCLYVAIPHPGLDESSNDHQLAALYSVISSFFTSKRPGTPRADRYASCLSISDATTPFKVTRTFCTMMWIGETAPRLYLAREEFE